MWPTDWDGPCVPSGLSASTTELSHSLHSGRLAPERLFLVVPPWPQTWKTFLPSVVPHIFSISGLGGLWIPRVDGQCHPRPEQSCPRFFWECPHVMVAERFPTDASAQRRHKTQSQESPWEAAALSSSRVKSVKRGTKTGRPLARTRTTSNPKATDGLAAAAFHSCRGLFQGPSNNPPFNFT